MAVVKLAGQLVMADYLRHSHQGNEENYGLFGGFL